ncbi:Ger(x)C family spore germination protein [Ornithinibacillus sp. 4-3]|uniref:Ger(X)C family spore germination protein n=1 Tax=Ornithinibacillus sp. 4-3 TaxID=3231488 RepID=A0AB39HS92_9BACI
MNKRIFMLLLFVGFLFGCVDKKEPERMFYVHGLGVDYQDGEHIVYAQIINFANVAKSEQPRTDIEQSEVMQGRGKTMVDAIYNFYRSVDEYVYWGNLTFIVFSEEVLKNGKMNMVLEAITRFIETRYQVWVYSTKEPVEEVLLVTPINYSSIILSKLSDPENSFEVDAYVHPVNIRELFIGLNEPGHELPIPAVGIWDNRQNSKGTKKAVAYDGVGIITTTGFKGTITDGSLEGFKWMHGNTTIGEVTFLYDTEDKDTPTEILINKVRVKTKPKVDEGEIKFDVQVKVTATVNSISTNADVDELKKRIEEEIRREILVTYHAALEINADIFGFSEQAYRKSFKDWKRVEEEGRIPLTEDTLDTVDVKVTKLVGGKKFLNPSIKK